MSEPIVVVAHWDIAAESLERLRALVGELRRLSLEEPGCLQYEVLRSEDTPLSVVLLERYRDRAALDAHRAASHYQEILIGSILPLLTARRVELLRPEAPA